MALTQKVTEIIGRAAEIEKLNLWEQGKAAKSLVKDDVVPVLLEMAQFIDGAREHLLKLIELQKQALLEIHAELKSNRDEISELKKQTLKAAELQSDISLQVAALKKDAVAAKKPAAKKPLPAVTA